MTKAFKKTGINNQKRAILKKIVKSGNKDTPHLLKQFVEESKEINENIQDLEKPHTFDEIKKITTYKGSDRKLKAIIKYYFFEVEVEMIKKVGRPEKKEERRKKRMRKLYILNFDKVCEVWQKSWYENVCETLRLTPEDMIKAITSLYKNNSDEYWKYWKTLSQEERKAEIENIRKGFPLFAQGIDEKQYCKRELKQQFTDLFYIDSMLRIPRLERITT